MVCQKKYTFTLSRKPKLTRWSMPTMCSMCASTSDFTANFAMRARDSLRVHSARSPSSQGGACPLYGTDVQRTATSFTLSKKPKLTMWGMSTVWNRCARESNVAASSDIAASFAM